MKYLIQFLFLCNFIFLLSGCWSSHEAEDLSIINIVGVDENEQGELELTANLVRPMPNTASASAGTNGDSEQPNLVSASGQSLFDAMSKLSSSISKRMYLGHVNVLIFGEMVARDHMESALDFFRRENDFRPNIKIFITKGSAKEVMQTKPALQSTIGLEVDKLSENDRFASAGTLKDISKFVEDLTSNTIDPTTSGITRSINKGIEFSSIETSGDGEARAKQQGETENETTNESSAAVALDGTAVFQGAKLKGWLNDRETRGLMWMLGEVSNNNIVVLPCSQGTVSLNTRDSKSRYSPQLSNDGTTMRVNIQVEADIGEYTCADPELDSRQIERLNRQLEETIEEEATAALRKAQKRWQADVFGFGKAIYRDNPKAWDKIAPDWRNGLLQNLRVDLNVSANISGHGMIEQPSKANESR